MALFAIWREDADAADLPRRLAAEAHIVPEQTVAATIATDGGAWRLAAFASATHFYSAAAQIWVRADEACIIQGVIWRSGARLLDAAAVAALLAVPGTALPGDVAGEYAIARLHRCGTLEAFGDPAGLHQLFARDALPAIANRAAFLALLADDWTPARGSALWLGAIGYRVGPESGWAGVAQVPQGARLTIGPDGRRLAPAPPVLPPVRGFSEALLEEGMAQARDALRVAAGDAERFDLPITGGKDSRAVLALALDAGLGPRLRLFTRGRPDHPDVRAGALIAEAVGLPHRREPPHGGDDPAGLDADAYLRLLATIAYQTDGGMGGWDNVTAAYAARETIVSGHLGELLKAYAKRAPGADARDPVALIRLQAPFDPLGLLRASAADALAATVTAQMEAARAAGAGDDDQPDLFYWRNRIPNWLGGIRGVKAFERQPILPLGVPALRALAFAMTPAERATELAHYRLVARAAPRLLAMPFAHQRWSAALADAPRTPPLLAEAGSALFGTWQWGINRDGHVRAGLAHLFGTLEVPLWEDVDRARLLALLGARRFDYFDAISLLGVAVAALHQAGVVEPDKLRPAPGATGAGAGRPADRPLRLRPPAPTGPIAVAGHLDMAAGGGRVAAATLVVTGAGPVVLQGWAHAPALPGAAPPVAAEVAGRVVATAPAEAARPDLAAAGIGDGCHGFALAIDPALLPAGARLVVRGLCADAPLTGGVLTVVHDVPTIVHDLQKPRGTATP